MLNMEPESFVISTWIKKGTLSAPRNSAFWWRWWRPSDLLSLSSWQKAEGLCLAFLPLEGPDSLLIVLFSVRPWPGAKLNLLSQGRVCSHEWEWAPSPAQSLAFHPTPTMVPSPVTFGGWACRPTGKSPLRSVSGTLHPAVSDNSWSGLWMSGRVSAAPGPASEG